MNALLQSIHKDLFQHELLEQTSIEEINHFVNNYPFAAAGRLLAAFKSGPHSEAAKTAGLYVHDPLVLNLLFSKAIQQPVTVQRPEKDGMVSAAVPDLKSVAVVDTEEHFSDAEAPEQTADRAAEEVPPLKIPALVIPEVTLSPGKEFSFEPYHTVDYFASQGIRLKKEDLEKDQFGKQLRSFTDWLRSMKKIEPVNAENQPASPAEDTIKKHAASSIEESDVETEAMAEVWIKQGKTARAMAIYKKLSLLNPSKSHYFAAKIEQLKD